MLTKRKTCDVDIIYVYPVKRLLLLQSHDNYDYLYCNQFYQNEIILSTWDFLGAKFGDMQ